MPLGEHRLFREFPITEYLPTSQGDAPVPYHVYNGYCVFVGGTADFQSVKNHLVTESLSPVRTVDGRTYMGIWLGAFDEANLGAHHELQFSFFVSERGEPVMSHPLGVLVTLIARPDVKMFCHRIWNDTMRVVAYNREALGLDARLSDSCIKRKTDGRVIFAVNAASSGSMLLSGVLQSTLGTSGRLYWDLLGATGFLRLWKYSCKPWATVGVINPRGTVLMESFEAKTHTVFRKSHLRYFDLAHDVLHIGDTCHASMDFQPQFVQCLEGFNFVYGKPARIA